MPFCGASSLVLSAITMSIGLMLTTGTRRDFPVRSDFHAGRALSLIHISGYSVSQIQQCQYIAQALGVLKVVPRSNKTTGKQTTSMYIIIPQALERFRFPPI